MYQELIEKNREYIRSIKSYRNFTTQIEKLIDWLNKNSIITLSWLRHTWRTSLVHNMLIKTQKLEDSFYYNAELDTLWSIKNKKNFITLFDLYVRIYWIPKVIILQNMNNIEWIKDLILQFYKSKKYKIVLVWNNIQIEWVTNVELYPMSITENNEKNIRWWLPAVRVIPDNSYKDFLLQTLRNDILIIDIITAYNIKNISLYYNVLSYISENDSYSSVREIHRNLRDQEIDISHLTLIDYLTSAVNTRLLSRCYRYDMKAENEISSKIQYYFWDVWIRNSLSHSHKLFPKNLLYLEFLWKWYTVYWWINWKFIFDFYATKWNSRFCIHFEDSTNKSQIRKTARKLAKIESSAEKFVIVENKKNIEWMRKFEEQGVKILELYEFVEQIK